MAKQVDRSKKHVELTRERARELAHLILFCIKQTPDKPCETPCELQKSKKWENIRVVFNDPE